MTDAHVLTELGHRLALLRLQQNLTQSALARQAGVGLRTVQRLEAGTVATQWSGVLRICRALGLLERFDLLIPEPLANPMAQLKLRGRKRQRASAPSTVVRESEPWKWGDAS